jgi:hypothetical protein
MLERAGGKALVPRLDRARLDAGIARVETLARAAQARIRATS